MHRKSISVKNFIGLKPQMFSPANFSTSMVQYIFNSLSHYKFTNYLILGMVLWALKIDVQYFYHLLYCYYKPLHCDKIIMIIEGVVKSLLHITIIIITSITNFKFAL